MSTDAPVFVAPADALPPADGRPRVLPLTVLVPAYNEATHLGTTLESLLASVPPPARVIVIDDASTDATGSVAQAYGVDVLRPACNSGSKAAAQMHALPEVDTPWCATVDADTLVTPDALERLCDAVADERQGRVGAACAFVKPRRVRSVWERGRYIEYLFSLTFHKPVQDAHRVPVVASGCCCVYATDALRSLGGWQNRTVAEDMDLTWTMLAADWGVRYVEHAVCEPVEPATLRVLRTQLRRWTHGFVQNAATHRAAVARTPALRLLVAAALLDSVLAFAVCFAVLPALVVFASPWWLLGYAWDLPVLAVPVLVKATQRGEVGRALVSLPCFVPLRLVNAWCAFEAVFSEWVLKRRLTAFEKGHAA